MFNKTPAGKYTRFFVQANGRNGIWYEGEWIDARPVSLDADDWFENVEDALSDKAWYEKHYPDHEYRVVQRNYDIEEIVCEPN